VLRFQSKLLPSTYLFSLLCSFAAVSGTLVCQANPAGATPAAQHENTPSAGAEPHSRYSFQFNTQGGGSVLHWRQQSGVLPPGLKLEDNGVLHGEPTRAGEYRFAISVTDNGRIRAVQKEFVLRVVEALTLIWKAPAHVNGSRIEGSVEVSNTTVDDVDLTFVVYAIAEDGRATAIGYQHLPLPHATTGMELPFGESLPSGAYIVHVDVVGEVASKNRIYRQPLQTAPLRVTVGP
jgi:hypothetical protein